MSVTPELVKTKLASMDSTQQSIVTVSNWLMFHRRAAKQVVDVWAQAVQDGSSIRKLNLIYLANEVAQQSRAKKRTEYPEAFAKVMPSAVGNVYRQANGDVQGRITRVVSVWRERSIFPESVLTEISSRLKTNTETAPPAQTHNTPAELRELVTTYNKLLATLSTASMTLGTTDSLYSDLMETEVNVLAPDVYKNKIAQLSGSIDAARGYVSTGISMREELLRQLQALQDLCTSEIGRETAVLADLANKAESVQRAGEEADRAVLNTLDSTATEMEPPMAEALTPPADEEDPVARLQAELGPSIAELLARQDGDAQTTQGGREEEEEEAYIP